MNEFNVYILLPNNAYKIYLYKKKRSRKEI